MIIEGKTVRETLLEEIANMHTFRIDFHARKNGARFRSWNNHGIITNDEIEQSLDKYVTKGAFQEYQTLINQSPKKGYTIYANHCGMPEFLAYGIEQGIFSKSQLESIPFDHGDTPESYVKSYGKKNLLSNLREKLLNPKPISTYSFFDDKDYDPHPVCSCGH